MKRLSCALLIFVVLSSGVLTVSVEAADAPTAASTPVKKAPTKSGAGKSAATKSAKSRAAAAAEVVSGPEVRNFQAFCDEWMHKLHDRETYNTSHIAWETHEGRVGGDYVGYATDCTCTAREEPGKDPIGKITYRETRYHREGATQTEALAAPGAVVEQSDVTEIFRFGKGRWQY